MTAAGQIIVIRFKRPVAIPVGKLADALPDYVSSARADPDGAAIRLSLARRVTINTMTAGERVFVDLLPDSWTGAPPGLPAEVVRELSERARAAERALRLQKANADARKKPPVRVRASVQPTFVRFVFEMPDDVGVSSVLNEQKLTLLFNAALNFDLADAKVAAPPNVASINQRIDGDTSVVEAELIGDVDVHSFREEKNYIVDVAFQQAEKAPLAQPPATEPHAAADRAPARTAAPMKRRRPRRSQPPPSRPQNAASARRNRRADVGDDRRAGEDRDQARGRNPSLRRSRRRACAGKTAGRGKPARLSRETCGYRGTAGSGRSKPAEAKPAEAKKAEVQEAAGDSRGRTPGKMTPASGDRRGRRQVRRRRQARQRCAARDLLFRRADAGGVVPPRRHGLAGVRRRPSRSTSSRSAARAGRCSPR